MRVLTIVSSCVSRCCWSARRGAGADYTLYSCGAYYNEDVFSAVLPPGGSVADGGSACPVRRLAAAWLNCNQRHRSMRAKAAGRVGGRRASGLEIVAASVTHPTSPSRTSTTARALGRRRVLGRRRSGAHQRNRRRGSWSGSPLRTSDSSSCAARPRAAQARTLVLTRLRASTSRVRETVGPSLSAPDRAVADTRAGSAASGR